MDIHPGQFVALFGGACAGSEAAHQLAKRGIYVAVFDQNVLPYGKIEDGLPKWHIKLRNKEEDKIDKKLSHPNIFFTPKTKLGRDIQFDDVVNKWGFSAVLLASGAWRDRPLPVEGIDNYVEKGFYYQNPFVDWFNHNHESDYDRLTYRVKDEAIVIGGGLASIDVAKILMLETTVKALEKKGIKTDVISLEHKGIAPTLASLEIPFSELGIKGCTLFYRRRNIDMPLGSMPPNPTHEKIAQIQKVRQKILKLAQEKYRFHYQECCKPVDKIIENGQLKGLIFQKTRVVDGKVVSIPNSEFGVKSPLIISSIGSIPEPIDGIPTNGELFNITDKATGKMEGYDNVFALGNAVAGKGNIRESELHSRKVIVHVMDNFFNWQEEDFTNASQNAWSHIKDDQTKKILNENQIQQILTRITQLQLKAGYNGNYSAWVDKHRPVRLEDSVSS